MRDKSEDNNVVKCIIVQTLPEERDIKEFSNQWIEANAWIKEREYIWVIKFIELFCNQNNFGLKESIMCWGRH